MFSSPALRLLGQCSHHIRFVALTALTCLASSAIVADAAPINYGDFAGTHVTYTMVTEDSGTDPVPPGMYGMPTVGGNTLNFNPVGFDSTSSDGDADITDGQLFFMIESNDPQTQAIQNFVLNETGDLTLAGNVPVGSISTSSTVQIAAVVEIVEVDGVALTTAIQLSGLSDPPLPVLAATFTELPGNTPSSGTWSLGVDGAGGPIFNTQWNGQLFVDVQDALIKSGTPFTRGATKVNVNIDNVLATTSVMGTDAAIAKKDFLTITTNIPEPSAACLLLLASGLGALAYRPRFVK